MRTPTVCQEYLSNVIEYLEHKGVSENKVVQFLGMNLSSQLNQQNRLTLRLFELLLAAGSKLLNDPDFGVNAGAYSPARAWGLVNYLGMSAPNTTAAIDGVVEFHKLLIDHGDFRFETLDDHQLSRLTWVIPERQLPSRQLIEFFFASWYRVNKPALDKWCSHRVIHVTHAKPAHESIFEQNMEATVCYSSDENYLEFDSHFLDRPVDYPHPAIHRALTKEAQHALANLEREDKTVREALESIRENLSGGTPKLNQTASALGLTARTLQRRLNDTSTNYKTLVDEARKELARELLKSQDMPLTEVCSELGFCDQSAFNKAFKRWFGSPPGKYRETHFDATNLQ